MCVNFAIKQNFQFRMRSILRGRKHGWFGGLPPLPAGQQRLPRLSRGGGRSALDVRRLRGGRRVEQGRNSDVVHVRCAPHVFLGLGLRTEHRYTEE